MNTTFKKANLSCKDIIFEWLNEPHVQEFWDNSQDHYDDITNFINGRKEPSNYFDGIFTYWLGFMGNDPYCLIMTSEVLVSDDNPEIWNFNIMQGGKTYSLDFTIGNKKYLGRGMASPTLEAFCKFFKSEVDNEVKQFFIDPDENNLKAKHVYGKAGFIDAGNFEMPRGFFEGHKSHLMIKTA